MITPLLYHAALRGIFGKRDQYSRSSITDALFVYLDGEPEPESFAQVDSRFRNRPLVCLAKAWSAGGSNMAQRAGHTDSDRYQRDNGRLAVGAGKRSGYSMLM